MPTWVGQYEPATRTFLFVDQSSPNFFRATWKGLRLLRFFQMFDMSIRSRDIRDQSRKLTEIAPNFGRFLPSQILGSGPSKSYTHFITPASQRIAWKKFCENTPTSPGVIRAHKLNFGPNFKFSGLKFLRGPPSQLWCALASLGQSVTHVKIWGAKAEM